MDDKYQVLSDLQLFAYDDVGHILGFDVDVVFLSPDP